MGKPPASRHCIGPHPTFSHHSGNSLGFLAKNRKRFSWVLFQNRCRCWPLWQVTFYDKRTQFRIKHLYDVVEDSQRYNHGNKDGRRVTDLKTQNLHVININIELKYSAYHNDGSGNLKQTMQILSKIGRNNCINVVDILAEPVDYSAQRRGIKKGHGSTHNTLEHSLVLLSTGI